MDYAHEQADKELKKLEKKIEKEYRKAYKEVKKKADTYLAQFKKEDADKKKLVKAKLMSQKDYIAWREKAMLSGKRWSDMADVLAQDLVNADKIAASLIRDQLPDIYALNANYGAYEIENGLGINTSWTMYDHRTVENLMRKDPQVVPMPKMDIPKDLRWNRQKIHSAITQGVLQGDSIPHIAQRLRGVTNMDMVAAIRNARTYTTAAENKGRIDSYKYAQDLGIELQKEWMSTPDGRTRDSHVDLDGERVEIDGTFSNGCRYPADPMGEPAEVYNCRCTLVAAVKGRQYHDNRFTRLPDGMTYEDWKSHKLKGETESYYKELDESKFVNEHFSSNDASRINQRFKELDSIYHAKIDSVVPLLQDEQERYDLFKSNYMAKLKADNPRMRQSTIEKRANEVMGPRPTKDTIDHFEGANFNMVTRRMTINNYGISQDGGIEKDIETRQKRMDRWLRRHGTMDEYSRGNAGVTHEASFIHEYGHAIDATYKVAEDERFLTFYRQFTKDDIVHKVSDYASTNEQEFIAECFLDSFMGDTQTETSKQFMSILKEIIG